MPQRSRAGRRLGPNPAVGICSTGESRCSWSSASSAATTPKGRPSDHAAGVQLADRPQMSRRGRKRRVIIVAICTSLAADRWATWVLPAVHPTGTRRRREVHPPPRSGVKRLDHGPPSRRDRPRRPARVLRRVHRPLAQPHVSALRRRHARAAWHAEDRLTAPRPWRSCPAAARSRWRRSRASWRTASTASSYATGCSATAGPRSSTPGAIAKSATCVSGPPRRRRAPGGLAAGPRRRGRRHDSGRAARGRLRAARRDLGRDAAHRRLRAPRCRLPPTRSVACWCSTASRRAPCGSTWPPSASTCSSARPRRAGSGSPAAGVRLARPGRSRGGAGLSLVELRRRPQGVARRRRGLPGRPGHVPRHPAHRRPRAQRDAHARDLRPGPRHGSRIPARARPQGSRPSSRRAAFLPLPPTTWPPRAWWSCTPTTRR